MRQVAFGNFLSPPGSTLGLDGLSCCRLNCGRSRRASCKMGCVPSYKFRRALFCCQSIVLGWVVNPSHEPTPLICWRPCAAGRVCVGWGGVWGGDCLILFPRFSDLSKFDCNLMLTFYWVMYMIVDFVDFVIFNINNDNHNPHVSISLFHIFCFFCFPTCIYRQHIYNS